MKAWQKRLIWYVPLTALCLFILYHFLHTSIPEGSVPIHDIVSYCIGDATNNGVPVLIAISGDGKIETGERHGELLLVCDASAEADMDKLGCIPPEKIYHSIDLSGIKPLKVQLGDINEDGINEISICVYKTAKFHPVMAKRPFFFNLIDGNLIPVWLGSRLSRPFDDYILYDIDADATDEIISIEQLENGNRVIALYNWKGFGFEMFAQSEAFNGELNFDSVLTSEATDTRAFNVILFNGVDYTKLNFEFFDNKLVYSIKD